MSVVIVEMSNMSDSKELYNQKPPIACVAFLYIMLALCVAIFVWLNSGEINVIIKCSGIVKVYENQNARELEEGTEQQFCMESYISSSDIQCLEEGMKVRCSFNALPASEYGYVEGKVIEISEELYIDDEGDGYYIVKSWLCDTELVGRKGKAISLQEEMTGSVSILAGTQKVLDYIEECMR